MAERSERSAPSSMTLLARTDPYVFAVFSVLSVLSAFSAFSVL